ncbi:MAG: hypothetical protein JJE03_06915 [Peptostreptococcaceae bacterium]|nr:hypothetical protein [Peptostreptococcaceae bacterium]
MILKDYSVSFTSYAPVNNKDYPAVGEYKIEFTYEDTSFTTKIHVVDTTKPKFNKCESIEIMQGESLEYKNYITATDLSSVKIIFNDEEVILMKLENIN